MDAFLLFMFTAMLTKLMNTYPPHLEMWLPV